MAKTNQASTRRPKPKICSFCGNPLFCSFCGNPLAGTEWTSSKLDAWHITCAKQYAEDATVATKAVDVVTQVLTSALPPNVPPSFRRVIGARFTSSKTITAELVMFDGKPASVELKQWPHGWSHRWTGLEGGPSNWNAAIGKWERLPTN